MTTPAEKPSLKVNRIVTASSVATCCVPQCSFDFELTFGLSVLEMSKAERLQYGESLMTHAMVLTGVHIEVGLLRQIIR